MTNLGLGSLLCQNVKGAFWDVVGTVSKYCEKASQSLQAQVCIELPLAAFSFNTLGDKHLGGTRRQQRVSFQCLCTAIL